MLLNHFFYFCIKKTDYTFVLFLNIFLEVDLWISGFLQEVVELWKRSKLFPLLFNQELSMSKGSSDKVKVVVPVDSGRVAFAPKFKRRKVSAFRYILSGSRRGTASDFGISRQITIDQSSQGKS
ncbi:hypothetical protein J1N35_037509 [Gossypium stocksii]|uniref:Uncharacterized protein n=1 Tax=Gossypium stocksii TaxID=47602 RepID=A0A9D3UKN2_9ROSI|nr:hypothetical protein J1N35_037509 [Gossypium stocksii]